MVKSNNHAGLYTRFPYRYPAQLWFCMVTITPEFRLKAEFEGSLRKLLPLRERIKQTDELIDAVVYKLYGLTEEEIRIGEGKANEEKAN